MSLTHKLADFGVSLGKKVAYRKLKSNSCPNRTVVNGLKLKKRMQARGDVFVKQSVQPVVTTPNPLKVVVDKNYEAMCTAQEKYGFYSTNYQDAVYRFSRSWIEYRNSIKKM